MSQIDVADIDLPSAEAGPRVWLLGGFHGPRVPTARPVAAPGLLRLEDQFTLFQPRALRAIGSCSAWACASKACNGALPMPRPRPGAAG